MYEYSPSQKCGDPHRRMYKMITPDIDIPHIISLQYLWCHIVCASLAVRQEVLGLEVSVHEPHQVVADIHDGDDVAARRGARPFP
jgi:hypothetical protein